jgi:L-fuconolactonase
VIFGGDWPICLKRAALREWIDALAQIISSRPADEQSRLWSGNANRFYKLTA